MKDKILTFIIGVLVGAIITTLGFLIYNKVVVKNNFNQPEMMQMNGNEQMQQPAGDMMGEPPEKPSGDNGEEPPTMPDNSNTNVNS